MVKALLDSGCTSSILGRGSIKLLHDLEIPYKKLISFVTTTDGTPNRVEGYVNLPIKYHNVVKTISFGIVPSLGQEMYLGVDFWRAFQIAPEIVSEVGELNETKAHLLSVDEKEQLESKGKEFVSVL